MFYLFDILSSYSFTGDCMLTLASTVKTRTKESYLIRSSPCIPWHSFFAKLPTEGSSCWHLLTGSLQFSAFSVYQQVPVEFPVIPEAQHLTFENGWC